MKKLIIIFGTFLIISCSGNSIYFDMDRNGIVSCHGSLISKVHIKSLDDNFDSYKFLLDDSRKGVGVKVFDVKRIDPAFIITDYRDNIINHLDFRLKPSTKYEISHTSKGDAADQSIIIELDEKGIIIDANVLSCN